MRQRQKLEERKFNKKLTLWARARGQKLAVPVADPATGEILFEEGHVLTGEECRQLAAIPNPAEFDRYYNL